MKRFIVSMCLLCLWGSILRAEPARVVVKGAGTKVWIYGGHGMQRRAFTAGIPDSVADLPPVQEITVPEASCGDLLFLIADGDPSWLKVGAGKTVVVDVKGMPWRFSGDLKKENAYLRDWTRSFHFGRPNMLMVRTLAMYKGLDGKYRTYPAPEEVYSGDNMDWLLTLKDKALHQLDKARLKDKAFVREQRRRILFSWLEMNINSYTYAKGKSEVPEKALDFLKGLSFEDNSILTYPECDAILDGYVSLMEQTRKFQTTADGYLAARASLLADPQVREHYVLQELVRVIRRGHWLYGTDRLLGSVRGMMVTDAGRKQYAGLSEEYQRLLHSPDNHIGTPVVDCGFETFDGKEMKLSDFRGKYLFIDMWASWCIPCKYQIPFLRKIEEEFAGKDITFLALSVDRQKDKAAWKKLVTANGLEGTSGIFPAAFDNPLCKTYKVTGVPRFMLIDPDGVIVMDKARRPSDPVLRLQLLELLGTPAAR